MRFALRLYLPLALAALCILLTIFVPVPVGDESQVKLEAAVQIGFLGVKVPLNTWMQHVWIVRATMLALAAALVFFAISLDFSRYFPPKLRMDVYFDVRGIQRTVGVLQERDLLLPDNWESLMSQYYEDVGSRLGSLLQAKKSKGPAVPEDRLRELLTAKGETTFRVEKVGWLTYKIVESNGTLKYQIDAPLRPLRKFEGEFRLRDTPANHIRPSLRELFRSPSVVIKPEFKQAFSTEEGWTNSPFDHIVVGMTRVELLPVPAFSNTLYLWRTPGGASVPVGYAVYY